MAVSELIVAPPQQQRPRGIPHSPTNLFFVPVEIRIDGVHALHAFKKLIHTTQIIIRGSQSVRILAIIVSDNVPKRTNPVRHRRIGRAPVAAQPGCERGIPGDEHRSQKLGMPTRLRTKGGPTP